MSSDAGGIPAGMRDLTDPIPGGVASLNHRLMAGIPAGMRELASLPG
jgi:hypothetical protein